MSGYIKGQDRNQMVLYRETMDEMVSEENEVRVIDRFVDVMDIEEKGIEKARPKERGRNAYDPRDILKLYIYGYRNKIRSSRKLARLCETNIEVMWLIRGLRPDYRTISDFRKNNAKALKEVFKETVMIAEEMKLLGEVASQDGYKVEAVNSKERNYTLNKLDERIERAKKRVKELEIYLEEMDEVDKKETKEEELRITEEMVEEMRRRVEEKKSKKKQKKKK